MHNLRFRLQILMLALSVCVVVPTIALPLNTMAASESMPYRELPGYPTPAPPELPDFPAPPSASNIVYKNTDGAKIMLHVVGDTDTGIYNISESIWWTYHWQDVYTMLQWQHESGHWYDVDGWRGTLDTVQDNVGLKEWWLSWTQFGTGPYRWVVYSHQGGKHLASSEPFFLPVIPNTTLHIKVPIAP